MTLYLNAKTVWNKSKLVFMSSDFSTTHWSSAPLSRVKTLNQRKIKDSKKSNVNLHLTETE